MLQKARMSHSPPVEKESLHTEEVEHVFVNEEKRNLKDRFRPGREWYLPGAHSKTLGNWVKQPNLRQDVNTWGMRAET